MARSPRNPRPPVKPLKPKAPRKPKAPNLVLLPLPDAAELPRPNTKEAQSFEPTDRQRLFHEVAVRCLVAGKVHPTAWMAEYYEVYNDRLTSTEFGQWKLNRKFVQWFYADLRYTPDDNDLAVADAVFMQTIVKGVAAGDARSMEIYANIRGFRKRPTNPNEGDGNVVERAIDDYVNTPTAAGWGEVKK